MQRYHFNLDNGEAHPDPEGTELRDVQAARDVALMVLTQAVVSRPQMLWSTEHLQLTVTDDTGLTLFSLTLSSHDAPSIAKAPPGFS